MDSGEYACAFSMFPTSSSEDLMAIVPMPAASSRAAEEHVGLSPKLRDAMFCHMILRKQKPEDRSR